MATLLLALLYVAFVSLGLPDSLTGSAWPVMHQDLGVALSSAGVITMIISFGTVVSSLLFDRLTAKFGTGAVTAVSTLLTQSSVQDVTDADAAAEDEKNIVKAEMTSTSAGLVMMIDKVIMLIALITFRIGWWGTIYCQQILLGMLTIFGPIQWAFSLLPKWEGAWAKWIIRYLTVHFYGAMLYFVGFYVLLLFDVVINIQYNDLAAVTASDESVVNYLQNAFFSAGYLMAASVVALKCLNLVPDLAAWMIPDGDTAFSTRSFGEGVATSMRQSASRLIGV